MAMNDNCRVMDCSKALIQRSELPKKDEGSSPRWQWSWNDFQRSEIL
jgi:hypothetical protein